VPGDGRERFQQRRDLEVLWLSADAGHPHGLQVDRHCALCQPHADVAVIECARCGNGPMLTGALAVELASTERLPDLVERRLALSWWQTGPDLLCDEHG
jgi:hypothetical protein